MDLNDMVDFFYNIQFKIGCNKIQTLWNKGISFILAVWYPIYCRIFPIKSLGVDKRAKRKIMISLTSFPDRVDCLSICINSLLRQKVKPTKIVLWLSEEQFPDYKLPKSLRNLEKYGLEIEFREGDLKPHKKTYYAFKENPEFIVISVDDDVIYPESLVERLLKGYEAYPDCVSCNIAHEIQLANGEPDKYDNWNGGAIGLCGPSYRFTAIGVGGVLYPPNCFDERYFDIDKIRELCLYTDDLWLKYNEVRQGIRVNKLFADAKIPVVIISSQKEALTKQNNGRAKRNDTVIENLQKEFCIKWSELR